MSNLMLEVRYVGTYSITVILKRTTFMDYLQTTFIYITQMFTYFNKRSRLSLSVYERLFIFTICLKLNKVKVDLDL